MQRHVAFLRGINVGGHRVKMDRLRELFEALDLPDVATYLASGNVIFDADSERAGALESVIEDHLADALGYEVDTFIRSLDELEVIDGLDLFPSADDPEYRVHVAFLRAPPGDDVERKLRALGTDDDSFRIRGREMYWLRRGRMSDSTIELTHLAKALGGATNTMRNMNTVRRIVAKFSTARG